MRNGMAQLTAFGKDIGKRLIDLNKPLVNNTI
nr:MAG TPA: TRAFFICKING PROTEIN PARTICLE COMPLEX SUBUNIT TRANSPORT, TRAPP COMPLEX, BET3 [Caudoviricetes sp.]